MSVRLAWRETSVEGMLNGSLQFVHILRGGPDRPNSAVKHHTGRCNGRQLYFQDDGRPGSALQRDFYRQTIHGSSEFLLWFRRRRLWRSGCRSAGRPEVEAILRAASNNSQRGGGSLSFLGRRE